MSKRKKQPPNKQASDKTSPDEQNKSALPPPCPPKPNRTLLIISLVSVIAWLLFLAVVAVMG